MEEDEHSREYMKRKAWRSTKYLGNKQQRETTFAVLFCAEPLDHLAMKVHTHGTWTIIIRILSSHI